MNEDAIKTVEAIFWNDQDKDRWSNAVTLLKAMPRQEAQKLMKAARSRAEDQQTWYGIKDGVSQKEIKDNAKRIRDIATLTMAWIND